MSIEIYTPDLSNRHELTHAISLQTEVHYNDTGKITLTVSATDENIKNIVVGALYYDTDTGDTFIFRDVEIDSPNNEITANGYTADSLVNKRVISNSPEVTLVERDIYQLIEDNLRGLTLNIAELKNLTATTDVILHGGEILDEIIPILNEAGYGYRMIWDPEELEFTFEIYEGTDLTTGMHAVIFSEEDGTATGLEISNDESTFKNVAYVVGEYNETEVVKIVGTATGDERFEVWKDAAGVTPEDGETQAAYENRLIIYGAQELSNHVKRTSFSVSIDASELGTIYHLGDLVSCVSQKYGMVFDARITGVKHTLDAKKETFSLVLGEPKLTLIGEMKLRWQR